jgi:thiol:disulfide interchange protein
MARFQSTLSVPMFLTAAALAWLLWRQTGVAGLGVGLGATAVLAILLFWIGRQQSNGHSAVMPGAALVVASLAALLLLPPAAPPANRAVAGEPFSEARLVALRAEGKPVFLYFTADWCLTCKVNEQAAIDREEVRQAFAKAGIVTMVGDWTNADPAIGRFLEANGRSGVPYYVFYPKDGGTPQDLPQVLTPATLTALAR